MRIIILILLVTGIFLHAVGSRRLSMPSNQRLLQREAVADLRSEDKFSRVSVEFLLLDGRVVGQVPSAEARVQALASIRQSIPAGRVFDHLEVVAPRDQPARVVLGASGSGFSLAGEVGDPILGEALADALGKGRPVKNDLKVSDRVREPLWAGRAVDLVADYFSRIPEGVLELGEREFVLRGRVKGEKARDAVVAAVRPYLPEDGTLRNELGLLPDQPAALVAIQEGPRLRLSGKFSDGKAVDALVRSLDLAPIQVDNQLQADARVEPPSWSAALPGFLTGFFRQGPGQVELQGKRLVVRGDRPASKGRAALDPLLEAMRRAGCEVTDSIRLVPDLEPEFRARLANGSLALEGRLPGDSARDRLLAAAKPLGTAGLDSRLKVDSAVRSAPWIDSLPGLLQAFFANRQAGELVFDGKILRILGDLEGVRARETLVAEITRRLPPGATLDGSGLRVLPPPAPAPVPAPATAGGAPWLVVQFGDAERRIEGQLPVEADRKSLTAALAPQAPGIKLTDGLKVSAETGKAPWVGPVSRFLPEFGERVPGGRLEVRDGKLTLSGQAPDPRTRDSLLAALAAALPNEVVKVEDKMTVRQSGATAQAAPTFTVYFNAGSDWIRPDGRIEIDKAAAAAAALPPGGTVLVKGFADCRGDAMSNQKLSELRVVAVRQSLLEHGLRGESLELIGVGDREANPGKSEAVWSKDRRVEITTVRK